MGELAIRRNRGVAVPQYQPVGKAEKQAGSTSIQRAAKSPGFTVSATLQQLMDRVSQADSRTRESRRTLQAGESVLTEVKDALDRIGDLARRSAGGKADRAALQAELEALRADIDRMAGSASAGSTPLFLDGGAEGTGELEALLHTLMGQVSAKEEAALPDWLMKGIAQDLPSADQLLDALGLDKTASGAELLAALRSHSLDSSSAAASLATLYLGMTISGGDSPQDALAGIQQLLDKLADGVPLDQAIEQLTGGEFTSLADFEAQFSDGTAPGLQDFLTGLLLADGGSLLSPTAPMLSLLAGLEGIDLELLMGLLTVSQNSEAGLEPAQADSADQTAPGAAPASPPAVLQQEQVQVTGRDLSGVSFQAEGNVLTIGGTGDLTVQGTAREGGQQGLTIQLAGSGTVTLQNVEGARLILDPAASPRLFSAGVNLLSQADLPEGASLTLDGTGLLKIQALVANATNTLRFAGGAVVLEEPGGEDTKPLDARLVLEAPVSLAARAATVTDAGGKPLEAFDLVWKALLPGWSGITSLSVDGRQVKLALMNGDPARLWLNKGEHGSPVHALFLRGRDQSGRLQSRYAYLRWSQYARAFEVFSLYPNPFTITGGEAGKDWVYEEESHTLRILSDQVTAISGGPGTDASQSPFSGRIALADSIGALSLSLGGVTCRVSSGRAFDLGRENEVTLLLEGGASNLFESGSGFAGISLGDGTTLNIDCADPQDAGTLIATGSAGGAGIGRDSGGSRDRASQIWIRSGIVTATGTGGGAGIGAGRQGFMGSITILGGVVTSTGGKGGGAGIGGALGAPVGDISIRGGYVTAAAAYHAAAIGAGVQGECGDILITGTARIVKATGGSPGADIGACLFGGCGQVLISGGADIGNAQLSTRTGIPLRLGEDTVTLPQFRLSSEALGLNDLSLLTPEAAQSAQAVLDAGRQQVSQIQGVYSALGQRLDQNFSGLYGLTSAPVRNTDAATALLEDIRRTLLVQYAKIPRTQSRRTLEEIKHLFQ